MYLSGTAPLNLHRTLGFVLSASDDTETQEKGMLLTSCAKGRPFTAFVTSLPGLLSLPGTTMNGDGGRVLGNSGETIQRETSQPVLGICIELKPEEPMLSSLGFGVCLPQTPSCQDREEVDNEECAETYENKRLSYLTIWQIVSAHLQRWPHFSFQRITT